MGDLDRAGVGAGVTPRERELLTGMGNCFEACGADFDGTVRMVAEARRLEPTEVRRLLTEIRTQCADDPEFVRLRGRLPPEFPL